jgi:hypothetical protein
MRGVSVLLALAAALVACPVARPEGLERSGLPPEVRADYDTFALRCSRCHSLARPLNSGIDDDAYWELYVRRMRRQPGSGITAEDETVILRFLHFYSVQRKREKSGAGDAGQD